MTNRNPENKFFRDMNSLSPGDVIITDCPIHGRSAILVLARRGDWFDLSTDAPEGHISLAIDPKGPWRWDRHRARFTNEQGAVREHLVSGRVDAVQKRAGMDELGWFESLPRPDQVRFHVSPDNLIGNAGDPATKAKLHALVDRMRSSPGAQQATNAMVQIVELAFAGAEHLLDKHRVNMLVAAMNAVAGVASVNAERQDPTGDSADSLMAAIMAAVGGRGVGFMEVDPSNLGDILGAMTGGGRRERCDPRDEGERSDERTPRRGNGHDHSSPSFGSRHYGG